MKGFLKTLVIGSATTLAALIIVKSMAFLNSVIAARLLGPYDYGTYSVIFNLQNLVTIIACLGIPLSLVKYISQHKGIDPDTANRIGSHLMTMLLSSSIITSGLYLLCAHSIAVSIYGDEKLAFPIQLSSIVVLVSSVNLGLTSAVQGCREISRLARVNAIVAVIAQPIAYVMITMQGLPGALLALAISTSISIALLLTILRKALPVHLAFRRPRDGPYDRSVTYSFTVPSFLSSLMIVPAFWFGRTVLAVYADFESVGNFQVAESLSQLMLLIPAAISTPLLPMVSEMQARNSRNVGRPSSSLLAVVLLFVVPMAILAMPALERLIAVLYGADYQDAASIAALLFASSAFAATSTVMSTIMIGTGRMWLALGINAVWAMVYFVSAALLVPLYGSEGLATAYLLSHLAYLTILLTYFGRVYEIRAHVFSIPVAVLLAQTVIFVLVLSSQSIAVSVASSVTVAVLASVVTVKFVLGPAERGILVSIFRHMVRRNYS